jgi:arsenical pump membrane protein
MWVFVGLGAVVVVATGLLPGADAWNVAVDRGLPVLGFLLAITILAELADRAGVFDAAATACARAAKGSVPRLYLLVAALTTITTVVMSLDTTAVLLTPVVLALAARIGIRPVPFAMLVVWLANTASLLLPVSNLTNLLAVQREYLSSLEFMRHMALPELAAVVVTVGYLWVLFRRDLSGRFEVPDHLDIEDRWTFRICAIACAALVPAVVAGVAPWAAATVCAVVAIVVFAVRDRAGLGWQLIPWRLAIFTVGLFLLVMAIAEHGLTDALGRALGDSAFSNAFVSGAASNVVNNLPAYLAIEPAIPVGDTTRLFAVLLGTNAGPLILLWGSLATLLWRERCKARGVHISAVQFAAIGLGGVPLVLLASTAALMIST